MLSGSSLGACGELGRWKRWEARFWVPTQDVILSPLRHLSATCGYLLWRSCSPRLASNSPHPMPAGRVTVGPAFPIETARMEAEAVTEGHRMPGENFVFL